MDGLAPGSAQDQFCGLGRDREASGRRRSQAELGGNDAAIVLDDVEPTEIANKLFWSAFSNNGQICSAIKRVY